MLNRKPRVFIGSAGEGQRVAGAIRRQLVHATKSNVDATVWTASFLVGQTFTGALSEELERSDFAVMVFTGPDVVKSRKRVQRGPRDNVILELGLFAGRLGFERTYFVYDNRQDLKIPTDLLGVVGETYDGRDLDVDRAVKSACKKIGKRILKLGLFRTPLEAFCDALAGCWWERIAPFHLTPIGFVEIKLNAEGTGISFDSRNFDTSGTFAAEWRTQSCSVSLEDQMVLYSWTGHVFKYPDSPFWGLGDIRFQLDASGVLNRGHGRFLDSRAAKPKASKNRFGKLSRATKAEEKTMKSADDGAIAKLIRQKLGQI
jgi:hypothetical protein